MFLSIMLIFTGKPSVGLCYCLPLSQQVWAGGSQSLMPLFSCLWACRQW